MVFVEKKLLGKPLVLLGHLMRHKVHNLVLSDEDK